MFMVPGSQREVSPLWRRDPLRGAHAMAVRDAGTRPRWLRSGSFWEVGPTRCVSRDGPYV